MKLRKLLTYCAMLFVAPLCAANNAVAYQVASPDEAVVLIVTPGDSLYVSVAVDGITYARTTVGLDVRGVGVIGNNATVSAVEQRHVEGEIKVIEGENPSVYENFNEMTLDMGDFSLICRAYNEGVAWRMVTRLDKENVIINNEMVDFTFTGAPAVWFSEAPAAMNQWELSYVRYNSLSAIPAGKFGVNPMMVKYEDTGLGFTIIESDIDDFPGMFLQSLGNGHLVGKYACYPKTTNNGSIYDDQRVLTRYEYIARTVGNREYPWRGIIVSRADVELLNNDLVYMLADEQKLTDTSWIKGGKTGFDWLVDGVLEGVDIPNGPEHPRSLELFKYWVDFCAEYGLEYMCCDAGWDESYMAALCQYAAERNVKIFVWDFYNMMLQDEARLDRFKKYGIAGVKVDFIARDDQLAINWLAQMAEMTAKRQMLLLMHGCPKPTGLHRTYPNIISYEAVHGLENNKWDRSCNPTYMVEWPFLRMLGGAADATPGLLSNCTYRHFAIKPTGRPDCTGTRANGMAMYVVFHQTLGFISDSPTEYYKVPDIMEWLKLVPTVWDETLPLAGEMSEYIVMARRKGQEWWVGAMNKMDNQRSQYSRDIHIDFSFLTPGVTYEAHIIKDVEDSNRDASLYEIERTELTAESAADYWLANGGGIAMHIYPKGSDNVPSIEHDNASDISVRYDATTQHLTVDSSSLIETLYIIDVLGRIQPIEALLPARHIELPLHSLHRGVYWLMTSTAQERISSQFIK